LLPLRFPKVWSVLGWLLVAGVIIGSLAPGNSLPDLSVNDKLQHASAYGLLMVWFAGLYRRGLYPLIGAVLLALGVGLDLLQGLTPTRSLDPYDIAANFIGISVGFALSVWLLGGWCQRVEQRLLS
jgi:VanZ family protein